MLFFISTKFPIFDPDLSTVPGLNLAYGPTFTLFSIFTPSKCEKDKILTLSPIGDNVKILSFSHLEGVKIENNVNVGPYARLRPGTVLKSGSKIGNFVEIKKSIVGNSSKINHLSYVGDTKIGKKVNIGAGTITCNYDGIKKNNTIIDDGVFIGSNSSLVAPIKLEKKSIIGAGSVITKKVSKNSLALTRADQIEKKNYKRKK